LPGLLAALIVSLIAVAAPAHAATMSSCANNPGSPANVDGTLYTQFTCSLYDDASSYSIDLTPFMTQGGANFFDNLVGAGYLVVLNGDPNVVSANDTNDAALFNQSLWQTVLFWPGDQDAGTASDSLSVYWAGAFPAASVVQAFDESLYGGPDSIFFVQSMGAETVYAPNPEGPNGGNVYDIFVPEPSSLSLAGAGLFGFAVFAWYRRRKPSADLA
jgi:hypothetical protein